MPGFRPLDGSQTRQLIDTEQLYTAFREAQGERLRRFQGSMSWKRVSGNQYLYRKTDDRWVSLGRRSEETEHIHDRFQHGRQEAKERIRLLDERIRRNAPINRAMGLGRVPWVAARLLRRLEQERLLGGAISVVGTHALYAYERMAGGHFSADYVATQDIDLLYDARNGLRFLASNTREEGLRGVLRGVDSSFQPMTPSSYRAVNDTGFIVDLIMPMPSPPSRARDTGRIGISREDMTAAEIEGLSWLQNSPQIQQIVIDERGYPLRLDAPDPRAFALHKLWVSERVDRDRMKARRDSAQARAVAGLVVRHLPQLRFDDSALGALPRTLRERTGDLLASAQTWGGEERIDW